MARESQRSSLEHQLSGCSIFCSCSHESICGLTLLIKDLTDELIGALATDSWKSPLMAGSARQVAGLSLWCSAVCCNSSQIVGCYPCHTCRPASIVVDSGDNGLCGMLLPRARRDHDERRDGFCFSTRQTHCVRSAGRKNRPQTPTNEHFRLFFSLQPLA